MVNSKKVEEKIVTIQQTTTELVSNIDFGGVCIQNTETYPCNNNDTAFCYPFSSVLTEFRTKVCILKHQNSRSCVPNAIFLSIARGTTTKLTDAHKHSTSNVLHSQFSIGNSRVKRKPKTTSKQIEQKLICDHVWVCVCE